MGSFASRNWPLALGILGGLLGLWWRGGAFVLDGQPAGYQWPSWVFAAWNWRHGHPQMLDPFRDPLHAILVGSAGERLGYANAALLVSGVALLLLMLSATSIAHTLAGRWAGALTALTLPLAPLAASGTRWGTAYPLLAAGLTASFAAALRYAHTAHPLALAAWAIASILASWTDDRGLLTLPTLALLAWTVPRHSRRSGTVLLGVVLLVGMLGQAAPSLVGQSRALSWSQKRAVQTRVVRRWTTQTMDTELATACTPVPESSLITPAFLTTPCAVRVLDHNRTHALPGVTAWPGALLLAAWLALLMWRRRPLVLATAVVLACTVLPMAILTPWPARYQLLFTGLLAPVVPVALVMLVPTRHARWLALLVPASVVLLWALDPHHHARHPVRGIDARWRRPGEVATELEALLGPHDRIVDCAGQFVEVALLPHHVGRTGPHLSVPDARPCLTWLSTPPGTGVHVLLLPTTGDPQLVALTERAAAHPDWEPVAPPALRDAPFTVWKRGPRP